MKLKDLILLLTLGAIWGSSFIFLKILAPVVGIYMTVSFRVVLAAAVMLLIFAFLRKLPDYRKYWKEYAVVALLNLVIPFGLITYSINNLPSSTVAILNATTPLFALAIGSVWMKERITAKKVSGLFTAVTGLVILLGWMPLELTKDVLLSIGFSLLAALCYAVAGVFIKARIHEPEPVKTATGQVTVGALLLLPVLFVQEPVFNAGGNILMALVVLGVVCTALAYVLFFRLIQNVSAANASLVTVLVPVFSTIWGLIFLNEGVTLTFLLGLGLIVASLIMILTPDVKHTIHSTPVKTDKLHCYYCIN